MNKKDGDVMEDIKLVNTDLNPVREIFQIIGCLMKEPNLLKESKYKLLRKDFPEMFHKSLFASINNLVLQGIGDIDEIAVDNYLSGYEDHYGIFKSNDGMQWLIKAQEKAVISNFEYNYNQLKKFTLLRSYEEKGVYVGDIYNINVIGIKEQEKMQQSFDDMTVKDILNHFKNMQLELEEEFGTNSETSMKKAGEGSFEQKEKFKNSPLMGLGMESEMLTTMTRGALKGRFILSSSDSGAGEVICRLM